MMLAHRIFSYFRHSKTTADEPLPTISSCASPTGMWPAYENALGYRYASPNGDGLPHGISAIPSLIHLLFTVH